MDSAKINDWMQVIGIFAVVASLVFVGMQMRQDQEIAITETRSSVTQIIGDLATIIEVAPGTWKRGLDGEELSEEESITFLAMAVAVESHFFNVYLRFLRLSIGDPDAITRNFAYALYVYPGLQRAYVSKSKYEASRNGAFDAPPLPDVFQVSVLAHLKELDKRSPTVPEEKRYIFW